MRRFVAITRTAAIETLSQPLSAVLFPAAALAVHLLPAFQYHRLGAPGRLAQETGLSALFVFGLVFAVPAAARIVGGDLERGTAAAALALGVPRSLYFLSRTAGVCAVFAMFSVAIYAASALSSFSCMTAAGMMTGEGVSRVWGPAFAAGVGASLAPLLLAAALNRFLDRRFCMWTCILTTAFQLLGLLMLDGASRLVLIAPPFIALAAACFAYVALAAAFATRLKEKGVAAASAVAAATGFFAPAGFPVPNMRVFWLHDGCGSVVAPLFAGAALFALWSVAGCISVESRELG